MSNSDATHGSQPPSVPEFLKPGGGARAPEKAFHCPLWPECNCPDGTVQPDCPGLKNQVEDDGLVTVHPLLQEVRA